MRNRLASLTQGFGPAAAAVLAGCLLLSCALIAARVTTAAIADRRVAEREEVVVANGVRGWLSEVEGRVVGQTSWDNAVQNLGVKYDHAWARDNVGRFLHDFSGFEASYVLDANDHAVFAQIGEKEAPPSSYGSLTAATAPLVAKVRAGERAAGGVGWKPGQTKPHAPIQASAMALVNDLPVVITATLVQPDLGHVRLFGAAPIVVTIENLNGSAEKVLSDRFLLKNLHIHTAESVGLANEPSEAGVDLRDSVGRVVARMDWTPQQPAHELLKRSLPIMLALMVFLSALCTLLFMRARRATQALIASESRSKHIAYHDHLTGLPNRALFSERMTQALAQLRRDGQPIGVVALDLDRFKQVNDSHGHGAGDQLIVEVARRLSGLARANDLVARLGGDEFAMICTGVTARGLAALARRITDGLSPPVDMPFGLVFPTASIGLALIADPRVDGGEALRRADVALYRAKDQGRARYNFYEPEMDQALRSRQELEQDLRAALTNGELTMLYQPQLDGERRMVGVEALVRWNHPQRGAISPAFFIPIAEECGLIDAVGEFTLREAFRDSRQWPDLKVAINVSAVQLRGGRFTEMAARLLRETGADSNAIELEITEGVLLEDDETTHETLSSLRHLGFSLALDDFGTGYSSLAYLRRYPVDKIKIDRSFITNLGVERECEAVVSAIVKLARALNLQVIAEGVETEQQRRDLKRIGCSHVQGFLYSPPLPAAEVERHSGTWTSQAEPALAHTATH